MSIVLSLLLGLLLGLSTAFAAAPVGQNLFIAGDGFTLEQALADAQAQRTSLDQGNTKILVTGNEAQRLVAARATPGVVDLVRKAQKGGASIFVCGKDLKALGARPDDLVPGVAAVRGYIPYDSSRIEDWERKLPRAPDRKSMAVCAVD